jgi:hypothetical protein
MKKKNDRDVKEKQVIHLDKGEFIPFKQTISRDANLNKPFVPLTIEDAKARQKKKDK